MEVFHYDTVKAEDVVMEGASRIRVRWLIDKKTGAKNFAMRIFEVEPDGYSPLHKHPWEHEVFILEGEGLLFDGQNSTLFKTGDVIFVQTNEMHQFRNKGKNTLKFICLIPYTKE